MLIICNFSRLTSNAMKCKYKKIKDKTLINTKWNQILTLQHYYFVARNLLRKIYIKTKNVVNIRPVKKTFILVIYAIISYFVNFIKKKKKNN